MQRSATFVGLIILSVIIGCAVAVTPCSDAAPTETPSSPTLLGWGVNFNGQLGPQRTKRTSLVTPAPMIASSLSSPSYTKVSCGVSHCLVMDGGRKVLAAGEGRYGQLGGGAASKKEKVASFSTWELFIGGTGRPVSFTNQSVVDIAAGWYSSCGIYKDDSDATSTNVYCVGRNNRGQLGNASISTEIAFAVPISLELPAGETFTKIALGPDHAAVATSANKVYTWGSGDSGALGTGKTDVARRPVALPFFPSRRGRDQIEGIQCGFRFCAVLASGRLYMWGLNDQNQLGGAFTGEFSSTPVLVIDGGVTKIAVGGAHVLAVVNGQLQCWGSGTMGQCGVEKTIPKNMKEEWKVATPTVIPAFATSKIYSIAAGAKHSLVLDTCGKVYSMGSLALGQLGTGNQGTVRNEFRSLSPLEIKSIAKRRLRGAAVFAGPYTSFIAGNSTTP